MTLEEKLESIIKDCSEDNWDSYYAKGITSEAADSARKLIKGFSIMPSSDGGITFEFDDGDVAMISFDIKSDGTLGNSYIGYSLKRVGDTWHKSCNWFIEVDDDLHLMHEGIKV